MFDNLFLICTFAFAVTGALKAIAHNFKFVGVLILSLMVGVGGGIIRDIILDKTPVAFLNTKYVIVCVIASLFVQFKIIKISYFVELFDALALAVFTAFTATNLLQENHKLVEIVVLSSITSCAGGVISDAFVGKTTLLSGKNTYISLSILGAFLSYGFHLFNVSLCNNLCITIVTIFIVRLYVLNKELCVSSI